MLLTKLENLRRRSIGLIIGKGGKNEDYIKKF